MSGSGTDDWVADTPYMSPMVLGGVDVGARQPGVLSLRLGVDIPMRPPIVVRTLRFCTEKALPC